MEEFAGRTGLGAGGHASKRYLWTDAFAVCNFLELFHRTGVKKYLQYALELVDQVHNILGRHREDDPRSGWISGLDENEGMAHPTLGGLRIGKKLNERKRSEVYDERLEWERDGQYFHYLTKWMHALNRVANMTGDQKYNRWAIELARAAHSKFVYEAAGSGQKRMYWKMSIDLSYPLVSAMGQHDALDGYITYLQLMTTAAADRQISADTGLDAEIADTMDICKDMGFSTDDPLGIGGLLSDACRVAQLMTGSGLQLDAILSKLLHGAREGLDAFMLTDALSYPGRYRLAFRELGLAIGLHAAEKTEAMISESGKSFVDPVFLSGQLESLAPYFYLSSEIENFWLQDGNQKSDTWTEHIDINSVMLATSMAPDGYLMIGNMP
ncbi:MAG: hypothetical protein B5M52_07975 [Helicobacteraceae bacterium 4484_230]|nr:MAG: hypothetical protein B5M52_07975 [Helicobacteraceae bacterium 4484_230]